LALRPERGVLTNFEVLLLTLEPRPV